MSTADGQRVDDRRRRFLAFFTSAGLGSTLLPGVLWAQLQQSDASEITAAMLKGALALSGLTFSEEEQAVMLRAANQNLGRFRAVRDVKIPSNVSPPYHFSALTPGFELKALPGTFAAGEMLDWEAPTGGYLLQACFATGAAAARGVLANAASGRA